MDHFKSFWLKDNSLCASHLDATGFYRQLPIVYLDLYFAVAMPLMLSGESLIFVLISSLTSSCGSVSRGLIQSILFPVEMIVSVVNISSYQVTISQSGRGPTRLSQ